MPAIKVQAAGSASPWEAISVTKSPSSGTPTSILDGATLDAGAMVDWVVVDANARAVSMSDDGTSFDIELNKGTLGNEDWGNCNDAHYNGGFAIRYPEKIDGEFSIELDVEIPSTSGNCVAGVAAWQEEASVSNDTPSMFSGFGRTGASSVIAPKAYLTGINGHTESNPEALISIGSGVRIKCRLQIDSSGKFRAYYTPDGGSETEHSPTSNDYKATVGGAHYVGIVFYSNTTSETFKIHSVTLTANARTANDKGLQKLADLDLSAVAAADWTANGDGHAWSVPGSNVPVYTYGTTGNSIDADGSNGIVLDPAVGKAFAGATQDGPVLYLKATDFWPAGYGTHRPLHVWVVIDVDGDPGTNGDSTLTLAWTKDVPGSAVYSSLEWAGHATADELFTRLGHGGGNTDGTHYSDLGVPDWMGIYASGQKINGFAGQGAGPAGPAEDASDRVAVSPTWSLSGVRANMLGTFGLEGNNGVVIAASAGTGAWATAPTIKRIRIYGMSP